MNIYILGSVAVFACIFGAIVKSKSKELGLSLSIAAIAVLFIAGLEIVQEIINNISVLEGFEDVYLDVVLKILGINIFAKICGSICDDAGEKGLSFTVDLCSKFACVLIALPLFEKLIEIIRAILQM